jgi:hypothetical protein
VGNKVIFHHPVTLILHSDEVREGRNLRHTNGDVAHGISSTMRRPLRMLEHVLNMSLNANAMQPLCALRRIYRAIPKYSSKLCVILSLKSHYISLPNLSFLPSNRNCGQEIKELNSSLSVVHQSHLRFLSSRDFFAELSSRLCVHFVDLCYVAHVVERVWGWMLKKSAISPNDFGAGIAC